MSLFPNGSTVTALDANEQIAVGYQGTVHFTSADPHGGLAYVRRRRGAAMTVTVVEPSRLLPVSVAVTSQVPAVYKVNPQCGFRNHGVSVGCHAQVGAGVPMTDSSPMSQRERNRRLRQPSAH